jgi:HAD superfamily hydrolase (TIGR01509 family)
VAAADRRRLTAPTALVLDLDGVVADTEPTAGAAIAETYAAAGVVLGEPELRELVGLEFGRLEPLLRARHRVAAEAAALRADFDRRYLAKLSYGVQPSPGLHDLLDEAAGAGTPVAIASSSPLPQVRMVLAATGVLPRVAAVAAGSEVARTKPAPDVYLLALDRLGVAAEGAVAIEDSAAGLAAARAAGLRCIALRTSSTADHDLGGATLVVGSLLELTLARLAAVAATPQASRDEAREIRR